MYFKDRVYSIQVYPFVDSAEQSLMGGHLLISKDYSGAPDVAGKLQMNLVFGTGLTQEDWEKLKAAGDKAFDLLKG